MATPDDVAAVIAGYEPRIRRALLQMLASLPATVSEAKLYAMIKAGDLNGIFALVDAAYVAAAAPFLNALAAAVTNAGDRAAKDISDQIERALRLNAAGARIPVPAGAMPSLGGATTGITGLDIEGFRYLPVNPRTVQATRTWQGNLIREMALKERERVMDHIRQGVLEGANPRQTARHIRENLGLTTTQSRHVTSFEADLDRIIDGGMRSARGWGIYTPKQIETLRVADPKKFKQLNFTARERAEGRRWAKISRAAGTLQYDPDKGIKPSKPIGFVDDKRTESGPSAYRIDAKGRPIDAMTSWRLRDKTFDPYIYDIVAAREAGDATAEAAARKRLGAKKAEMVQRYRERYLKHRSEVIARTETLRAANLGSYEAWRQAVEEGDLFTDAQVRRHWLTARDDRVRLDHRSIPGMNPGGVGMREPFKTPTGAVMIPPHEPNCRCGVQYRADLTK